MTSCSQLKHGIVHKIADASDDTELLTLLRENPVPGWITLSYERTGSYFTTPLGAMTHQAVIGRSATSGVPAAMFARTLFPAHVNGEVSRIAYLGDLRIRPNYRRRISLVRDGFETLKSLTAKPGNPPFHLTSIVRENRPARRLLEAGLEGLPVYEPIDTFKTIAIRTRRWGRPRGVRQARPEDADRIAEFANRINRPRQFSAVIGSARELAGGAWTGLAINDFLLFEDRNDIRGLIAVWDQSNFRRTVVRAYRPGISAMRPLLNILAAASGFPTLPAIGSDLRQVYLSLLCVDEDDRRIAVNLVHAALVLAARKKAELALVGLPATARLGRILAERFRCCVYESVFYLVYWRDDSAVVSSVGRTPPFVEIALL